MQLKKTKTILLSLVSLLGTASALTLSVVTMPLVTSQPASAESKCPNIQGGFQRADDNFIVYWNQYGCNISSNAPSVGFDHLIQGRWTGSNFDVTTTRRNIKNGCTTKMYGRVYKLDNSQFRSEVYGTDGRCDLPANYTENSMWTKR